MDNITSLVQQASSTDAMTQWSDERRKDFVSVFGKRVRASKFILLTCASYIKDKAEDKSFIGHNHSIQVNKFCQSAHRWDFRNEYSDLDRSLDDLDKIAKDKAQDILDTLPPLKKAVQVISPELSKKVEAREALVKEGKVLVSELDDLSTPLSLSDVNQKMTIGDFRKMVKGIEKKRTDLVNKLNEISKDERELSAEIDKALYSGIPGLSDAVVSAIKSCCEKAEAFDQMFRRVEEKVMFGDSQAATEMFRRFEQDEVDLSDKVKLELTAALDNLGIGRKQLTKKKAK